MRPNESKNEWAPLLSREPYYGGLRRQQTETKIYIAARKSMEEGYKGTSVHAEVVLLKPNKLLIDTNKGLPPPPSVPYALS